MFKFTKTNVFCSIIIILFFLFQKFIFQYSIETEIGTDIMQKQIIEQEHLATNHTKEEIQIWQIEIPKISLIATISEGTTKEVLKQYVGHFENTPKQQGNIGLAAYNRGYDINYFKDLKMLKEGDEIKYTHNGFEKLYEVEKCRIIRNTEWEYLEETEDNMLTLITYIENQPKYRRCIQAVEKDEEIY